MEDTNKLFVRYQIIKTFIVMASFTTLAIYFEKWWIILFVLLFNLSIEIKEGDK